MLGLSLCFFAFLELGVVEEKQKKRIIRIWIMVNRAIIALETELRDFSAECC
jgi:hypothetical protein